MLWVEYGCLRRRYHCHIGDLIEGGHVGGSVHGDLTLFRLVVLASDNRGGGLADCVVGFVVDVAIIVRKSLGFFPFVHHAFTQIIVLYSTIEDWFFHVNCVAVLGCRVC